MNAEGPGGLRQRAAIGCEARLRRVVTALFGLHDDPAAEPALIMALAEARQARSLCAAVRLDVLADGLGLVGDALQRLAETRHPVPLPAVTVLLHACGQLRAQAARAAAGQAPDPLDPTTAADLDQVGAPPAAHQEPPDHAGAETVIAPHAGPPAAPDPPAGETCAPSPEPPPSPPVEAGGAGGATEAGGAGDSAGSELLAGLLAPVAVAIQDARAHLARQLETADRLCLLAAPLSAGPLPPGPLPPGGPAPGPDAPGDRHR